MIYEKKYTHLRFSNVERNKDNTKTTIQVYSIDNNDFIGTIFILHDIKRLSFWAQPLVPLNDNFNNELIDFTEYVKETIKKQTGHIHMNAKFKVDFQYEIKKNEPPKQ